MTFLASSGKDTRNKHRSQQSRRLTQCLTQGKGSTASVGLDTALPLHNLDFTKYLKTVISFNLINPVKQAGQVIPHYQLHRGRNRAPEKANDSNLEPNLES